MATSFIVCLVLFSYFAGTARASPASIAAAVPVSGAVLQLPAVYDKHLSLLAQAIRVPATPLTPLVEIANFSSDAEIPLERLDDICTKSGRPSYSTYPGTPPRKDGMAATYDENIASNGVESLLSPSIALTLLYLFLVSAIIVNVYRLGCFTMNVLVLCLLLYWITIWVLVINDRLPTFSNVLWLHP